MTEPNTENNRLELLYLWIEDYKNIHHQGFNFSPDHRFIFEPVFEEVEENGQTVQRVKSGTLEELPTEKQPLKDFFQPDESVLNHWKNRDEKLGTICNITAIVGKNGAGKSNLLEFWIDRVLRMRDSVSEQIGNLSRKFFLIFAKGKEKYIFSWKLDIKFTSLQIASIRNLEYFDDCLSVFYSSLLASTKKGSRNIIYNNERKEKNIAYISLSDNSYLEGLSLEGLSLEGYRRQDLSRHIEFVHFLHSLPENRQFQLPFSVPSSMYISINHNYKERELELKRVADEKNVNNEFTQILLDSFRILVKEKELDSSYENELKILNILRVMKTVIYNNCTYNSQEEAMNRGYWTRFPFELYEETQSSYIENVDPFLKDSSSAGKESFKKDIEKSMKDFNEFLNQLKSLSLREIFRADAKCFVAEISDIHKFFISYMKLQFDFFIFQWGHPISSGEEKFLNLYSRFFWIKKIEVDFLLQEIWKKELLEKFNFNDYNNLLLLIDEGEVGFHPEWQRQYLKYLIDFFPQIYPGKNIQIILTTHSPFLVSDLPKENILFLEQGEEKDGNFSDGISKKGKCLVADGPENGKRKKEMKNTFGANIHTLFADSFFLDGGLMGEFAKGKIGELINLLQKDEELGSEEKHKIKTMIEIIGEPLIQRKLRQMYYAKIDYDPIRENEELKKEIERLKREQK